MSGGIYGMNRGTESSAVDFVTKRSAPLEVKNTFISKLNSTDSP